MHGVDFCPPLTPDLLVSFTTPASSMASFPIPNPLHPSKVDIEGGRVTAYGRCTLRPTNQASLDGECKLRGSCRVVNKVMERRIAGRGSVGVDLGLELSGRGRRGVRTLVGRLFLAACSSLARRKVHLLDGSFIFVFVLDISGRLRTRLSLGPALEVRRYKEPGGENSVP